MKTNYHKRGVLVHGYAVQDHPLYGTWANMLSRCRSTNAVGYENYGGRGITVCEEWGAFSCFALDMGLKPTTAHTLERRDNDLGYSKSNCVWATRTEQCLNRRRFKNNKSGSTGVVETKAGFFHAKFDFERERFDIGCFVTLEEATNARVAFERLFAIDRNSAIASIQTEHVSLISTTKVRGVTPHKDGGFIVRATVGGVRHYLGYFKTINEATNARSEFLKT